MKKIYASLGLVLIAGIIVFAVVAFLRENWGADQQPGAVESFLARWLVGRPRSSEADLPNPYPPTEENLRSGRELYEKHCAFCHGVEGRGTGDSGIQFYPPVPSLAEPENDLTDGQMHHIIMRGIRYTAMPSFARALTEEEVWKILTWVRKLSVESSR